jgi:hypothetical protein
MKGQMRIEFIVGVLIFAVVIVFIVTQTNTTFTNLLTDSKTDILKAKNLNSITILTEDTGDPIDWESIAQSNPENVRRVGLATTPYMLSVSKINRLRSNCELLNNFYLGSYRLKIYNSTNQLLFCGYETLEPPRSIETRYVKIGNDYGNVSLELW